MKDRYKLAPADGLSSWRASRRFTATRRCRRGGARQELPRWPFSRRRYRLRRHPIRQDICDRLVEDARIFLMIIDRQQASAHDAALDALVRDAFGSADRLPAAIAAARASGRPADEVDLLEQAAGRAQHSPLPAVPPPMVSHRRRSGSTES